jgi:hypothetical protein
MSASLDLHTVRTHPILYSLLDRGIVKVKDCRSSDRKAADSSAITPLGVRERLRPTLAFLTRNGVEFETLKQTVLPLRAESSISCARKLR